MARLNPAQHRILERHVERAIDALREADRLLKGVVAENIARCIAVIQEEARKVGKAEAATVRFDLASLPARLVPYLENPFAQALAFNLHCERTSQSHTQGGKDWMGGAAAVAARNLVFLPAQYVQLWEEGLLDKTRLVAIANRNLTAKGYAEVAELVRTRRKEDVDERLLRLPPGFLHVGRRGPGEAMQAARANGWVARLTHVDIPAELVVEAGAAVPDEPAEPPAQPPAAAEGGAGQAAGGEAATAAQQAAPAPAPSAASAPAAARWARPAAEKPAEAAQRALRAGLSGARVAPEVQEALQLSPDPMVLVERYLTAHRKTGDADPPEVTKTLFFAHAGPMQRLVADDKLLLRHFRPVKTQKRGQLFYRLLEVIEETMLEKNHLGDLAARGVADGEAMQAVRKVIVDLNKDPNRYLVVPEDWLGEVTRRHLYFGSRTRKEGAAYKWYRKIGPRFYLGAHKTKEELDEKAARRAAKETEGAEDANEAGAVDGDAGGEEDP